MDKSVLNKKEYRNVENYTSFLSIIPLKTPFPITLSVFIKVFLLPYPGLVGIIFSHPL